MIATVSCPGCLQPTTVKAGRLTVHDRRDGRKLCKFSGTWLRRRVRA